MSLKDEIKLDRLPRHVAIIMDGNGRWAKQKGNVRLFGHKNGVKAVREVTEAAAELGVPYVTLYAFSTENWNRPKAEVEGLMSLLVSTIADETPTLIKNNISLRVIGNQSLPPQVKAKLDECISNTAHCSRMTLTLALSYSSRWELTNVAQQIASEIKNGKLTPEEVDENTIQERLATSYMPDPELLIRTSGEYRISNFLLWQIAYSELYFTPTLWPDFRKDDFYKAILDFQSRERRFGMTSEQIQQ
ncbi:MAG: isoprenyl transferase [Marinilabiliaceae bacterium]|nr:isoprenyl transferase [Marinilabiliaceae bacterium]